MVRTYQAMLSFPVLQLLHNFVYCDKSVGNQIDFLQASCVQCAVKFVNAVPIICNHPRIGIIIDNIPHYGYETNHVSLKISIRTRSSILVSRV